MFAFSFTRRCSYFFIFLFLYNCGTHTQHEPKDQVTIRYHGARGSLPWPVKTGKIISSFGPRNTRFHDGIDIKTEEGTPIYAIEKGVVIYSGNQQRGYGNLILIQHEQDLLSVYAHNQKNLVKEKQFVKRGELIGRVGQTGRAECPHLHFEIRLHQHPQNPLFYLSGR